MRRVMEDENRREKTGCRRQKIEEEKIEIKGRELEDNYIDRSFSTFY